MTHPSRETGSTIVTKDDFYQCLRNQLGPELLSGSNLDALHDALTSLDTPADLTIVCRSLLEENLGSYWDRAYSMFMDCLDENSELTVSFGE